MQELDFVQAKFGHQYQAWVQFWLRRASHVGYVVLLGELLDFPEP